MTERAEDLQLEALRAFTLLTALRQDWRGALIVACGLGNGGSALSFAANIAGAGCLAIEPRPEAGRASLRSGACDFVVNTVDEALRVLKNEIRQHKAVSVGLTLDTNAALGELIDRGVLPELFADFRTSDSSGLSRAAHEFGALGTFIVDFDRSPTDPRYCIDAAAHVDTFAQELGARFQTFPFGSAEELRAFDTRLLGIIPGTDLRHRWCFAAPMFFYRDRPFRRAAFLTDQERECVLDISR